jgi:hypothetical protein
VFTLLTGCFVDLLRNFCRMDFSRFDFQKIGGLSNVSVFHDTFLLELTICL